MCVYAFLTLLLLASHAAAAPVQVRENRQAWREDTKISVPVVGGSLAATLCWQPGLSKPSKFVGVIIAGSGPTDRNGNSAEGVNANSYQYLARDLAALGMTTIRYDKRGVAGSSRLVNKETAPTLLFTNYTEDAAQVAKWVLDSQKAPCVWLIGHSEGALIAEVVGVGQRICGVVTVSGAGLDANAVLTKQIQASSPNPTPCRTQILVALESWAQGQRISASNISACVAPDPLATLAQSLFYQQTYVISWFAFSPTGYMANLGKLGKKVLITQGTNDLQITPADAIALFQAYPQASLLMVTHMNHVLKTVTSLDRAANLAAYNSPNVPINGLLPKTIFNFVAQAQSL